MSIKTKAAIKRFFHFFVGFSYLVLPMFALAQSVGDTPVSQGLGYFNLAMAGLTGVALAVAAVIITALGAIFDMCSWKTFLKVLAGISVIFGAAGIVMAIKALVTAL